MQGFLSRSIGVTACLLAGLAATAGKGHARPQYSVREGMYCTSCHVDPAGGGLRRANGFSYALARHAWEVEPQFEAWKVDPEITKGVRLGSDLRYAGFGLNEKAHYDDATGEDADDPPQAYAPYGMQGSIYFALSPVRQMTLYYNLDLAAGAVKQRDWYGLVHDLGSMRGYVKAGMIRSPYGLRLEDHTPFVRGREDGPSGERGIMDLDPRFTYPGVEVGIAPEGGFVHLAYQDENGTFSPNFQGGKLSAKSYSGKAGILRGPLMLGVTARTNGRGDNNPDTRATRYGAFAQFGCKSFVLTAEGDAGTDEVNAVPGSDEKVQAAYLAGEYYAGRAWTLRAEVNYMDHHLDHTDAGKEVSRRYGLGAELNPLPFLRLAANYRYVANSTAEVEGHAIVRDENWMIFYAVFSF